MLKSLNFNAEELRELYLDKKLSSIEIGKMKQCSYYKILNYLKKWGIPVRSHSEVQYLSSKSKQKLKNSEELRELYWGQGLSTLKIAKIKNCNPTTVRNTMIRFGIPLRSYSESHLREKSIFWRGGRSVSYDGYVKLSLHPDDPFHCMSVGSGNGFVLEHRYVMAKHIGRPLASNEIVHHINGNKVDNRIENLELTSLWGHNMLCRHCKLYEEVIGLRDENKKLREINQ